MIPDLTWNQLALTAIGLVTIVIVVAIVVQLVIAVFVSRRMRRMDRHFDAARDRMLGRRR